MANKNNMYLISHKITKPAIIMAIITSLFCSSAFAQTKDAKETKSTKDTTATTAAKPQGTIIAVLPLIERFFREYSKEGTATAIGNIFKTNKYIDSTRLPDLIAKIDKARELVGKYNGKELIVTKKASASLVLYSYLAKHEIQPVRFTFMFYKPKNDWMLYRLYFDDHVEAELQEASKL